MSDFDLQTAVARYRRDTHFPMGLSCAKQGDRLADAYRLFARELTPAQAQAVFGEFDRSDINAYTEALDVHALQCHVVDTQRRDAMFKVLAFELSGVQMAALAFHSTSGHREIGQAMAALPAGRSADKVAFIHTLHKTGLAQADVARLEAVPGGFEARKRFGVFGAAMAECLRGLKNDPAELERAMSVLSLDDLKLMLVGAMGFEEATAVASRQPTGDETSVFRVRPHAALGFLDTVAVAGSRRARCETLAAASHLTALLPQLQHAEPLGPSIAAVDAASDRLREGMPVEDQQVCGQRPESPPKPLPPNAI